MMFFIKEGLSRIGVIICPYDVLSPGFKVHAQPVASDVRALCRVDPGISEQEILMQQTAAFTRRHESRSLCSVHGSECKSSDKRVMTLEMQSYNFHKSMN